MSYSHIDFNIDGWNAWRGKVDESLNVFRQPAVSKTPSGGAGGTNYEVENWAPLTITSGLVYIFKAHTNNGGACNIKKTGGAVINIKLISGGNPVAGMIQNGGVYELRYDGTNLVLLNPSTVIYDDEIALGGNFSTNARLLVTAAIEGVSCDLYVPASSHSSTHVPSSNSGVIPSAYRPAALQAALYQITGSAVSRIQVTDTGTVSFLYADWAGVSFAQTSTGIGCHISWYVAA